ncbi:hypothetical protein MAHJHV61_32410 [Mycobacterium avium subsp. hominissuis]|nr:hypothetical protein MAH_0987 [Mycobacterium avium subsp. hominissuis TH135]
MVDRVDDQLDALPEQRGVIGGRRAGVRHQLVQPDALHEDRPRVHQRDVDVRALTQMVGGQRAGVSAADDDDMWFAAGHLGHGCLLFVRTCALETPQPASA